MTAKKTGKKASAGKKAPAKKASGGKKAPAKKAPGGKKAPAKKAPAAKKAAPKKAPAAKKAAPKKAPAAKKAAPKKEPVAKKAPAKPAPAERSGFSSLDVNMGHIFALRPRIETSFRPDDFRTARQQLEDESFKNANEAAQAVVEKALEFTHGDAVPGRLLKLALHRLNAVHNPVRAGFVPAWRRGWVGLVQGLGGVAGRRGARRLVGPARLASRVASEVERNDSDRQSHRRTESRPLPTPRPAGGSSDDVQR